MRRLSLAFLPLFLILACGSSSSSTDDGGDGGAIDGGTDGTTSPPDGSTTTPDGSTPGDAATGPFCPSLNPAPTLCEDFDDGTPPTSSVPQFGGSASCAIDAGAYVCQVPAGVSSVTNALLGIPITYDASAKKFVVSFAFRPDAAAPATGTLVIARAFLSNAHAVSIELTSENGPVIREQENPPGGLDVPSGNLASMPAAGAWTRYEMVLDVGAKTAALKANGAQIAAMNLTGTQYDRFALNLGLQSDSAFTARYDDVVMDLQK